MPADPAQFRLVDLHIHSPLSACYVDSIRPEANRSTRPQEIIDAAVGAGLDAIALTDHNGADMIETLRPLAAARGLALFPGIELSTRGGHLLALFDLDTSVQVLRDVLADVGFTPSQSGDGFQRTVVWMDTVMEAIDARGGIAIPAHVDREPRGFLASDERPSDKARIYRHPAVAALEITDPTRKDRWITGSDPRYNLPRACIQSSDAHAPEEIGRRPTLIRMERICLADLRAALAEPEQAVRFPNGPV